jgi:hypothetical protein
MRQSLWEVAAAHFVAHFRIAAAQAASHSMAPAGRRIGQSVAFAQPVLCTAAAAQAEHCASAASPISPAGITQRRASGVEAASAAKTSVNESQREPEARRVMDQASARACGRVFLPRQVSEIGGLAQALFGRTRVPAGTAPALHSGASPAMLPA